MNAKLKRRWFQFSLRTLLIIITLVCMGLGYWVHWSKDWIRQRHEWLANHPGQSGLNTGSSIGLTPPQPPAPLSLRLFGESGMPLVYVMPGDEQLEATRLFPEAVSMVFVQEGNYNLPGLVPSHDE
jgi:hypothetical protein